MGIIIILFLTLFIILSDRITDLFAPENIVRGIVVNASTGPAIKEPLECKGYDFDAYCLDISDVGLIVNANPLWNQVLKRVRVIGIYTGKDQFTLYLTGGRYMAFSSGVNWNDTDLMVYIEPAVLRDIMIHGSQGCMKSLSNDLAKVKVPDETREFFLTKLEELDIDYIASPSSWKLSPGFTYRC